MQVEGVNKDTDVLEGMRIDANDDDNERTIMMMMMMAINRLIGDGVKPYCIDLRSLIVKERGLFHVFFDLSETM